MASTWEKSEAQSSPYSKTSKQVREFLSTEQQTNPEFCPEGQSQANGLL